MNAPVMIPVELVGGMLCGFRTAVEPNEPPFDRYLFRPRTAGGRWVLAYKFTSRTTRKGKRWVLEFDCVVSWQSIGTSNTGGAA